MVCRRSYLNFDGFKVIWVCESISISGNLTKENLHHLYKDQLEGTTKLVEFSRVHESQSPFYKTKYNKNRSIRFGIEYLIIEGVEAIILGCTEIPLALSDDQIKGVPLIDATKVLALALILEALPEKLLEKYG